MGRAQGSQHPSLAPTRRGLASQTDFPGGDTAEHVARLVEAAQRGEFAAPLASLPRHHALESAPYAQEVLRAISDTAAAQTRRAAEREIVEGLDERGVGAVRTAREQMLLRDEISDAISTKLSEALADGHEVGPAQLQVMASLSASEAIRENVAAYSQAAA